MADQLALALDATAPGTYPSRGTSSLQRLFRTHLSELLARYDPEIAVRLGKYRQQRLPHRQIVFTFPKVLRVIFRHDHSLVGDISRLV
jgi:hypothetical protein